MSLPTSSLERYQLLFAVLAWLVPRKETNISEIARQFELDERDVIALIELASCCGVPPYTPDSLLDIYLDGTTVRANLGPKMAVPRQLSAPEAFALATTIRSILAVTPDQSGSPLESALKKLERVLGEIDTLTIEEKPPKLLPEIVRALEEKVQLEIEYFSLSQNKSETRTIEPLHLFSEQGFWYLESYCHKVSDYRNFRIDRINSIKILSAPVAASRKTVGFFENSDEIELEVDESLLGKFEKTSKRSLTQLENGNYIVAIPIGSKTWIENFMLELGPLARVISPVDYADSARIAASELLEIYQKV